MSKSVFGIGNGIRTRKGTAPSDGKSKIIIKIYKCWLGLIVIFLFFCWRVSLNSINNISKMVQDENDGTRLEMSRNTVKQIEFPPCIDKANKTFYKSGLVGHKPIHKSLNKVPLPPFTSGDSPICHLKSSPLSPVPVILLSFGRTGSSSTWQVMSRLTGHCFTCREYTGTNSNKSDVFFSNIRPGNNGNWILGYLCAQQNAYKDKGGIIGFKWKGYKPSLNNNASLDGLRMIAHYPNHQIKVVVLRRNLLDVVLSRIKQNLMKSLVHKNEHIAHCEPDNKTCIDAHKKFGSGLHVPTDYLLSVLHNLTVIEERFEQVFEELKVPHIKVSYEELYYRSDAEEWMRIFNFIGKGPSVNLSKDLVENAMEFVGTSNPSHRVTMSNYEEVKNLLKATEFEKFLH